MSSVESEIHIAASRGRNRHPVWVRLCHWLGTIGFVALAVTGFLILMVHPRLYWGEVGNDLTPALLELPISNNHRPAEWEVAVTFTEFAGTPLSANRTYEIFNQNGWARSLHFLAAWLLVATGVLYLVAGIATGHLRRRLLPQARDLRPAALLQDISAHLRLSFATRSDAPYGPLQRWAYAAVVFVALPFMVLTGLSMSPLVTAAFPVLKLIVGGHQTARTLHFAGYAVLLLFLLIHVVMVCLSGFRRQIRDMTTGS